MRALMSERRAHTTNAGAQALFRKLATALPGMETVQLPQKSALVDIKLSTPAQAPDAAAQGTACARC